jgi:hypothetical protein
MRKWLEVLSVTYQVEKSGQWAEPETQLMATPERDGSKAFEKLRGVLLEGKGAPSDVRLVRLEKLGSAAVYE